MNFFLSTDQIIQEMFFFSRNFLSADQIIRWSAWAADQQISQIGSADRVKSVGHIKSVI